MKKLHYTELLLFLLVFSILILFYLSSSLDLSIIYFMVSIFTLVLSSDIFFDNASVALSRLGMGDMISGTVFISLASVMDEIGLSVSSLIIHRTEIGMGAVEGSNFITMLFFCVIVALLYSRVSGSFRSDMAVILILSAISIYFSMDAGAIPWYASFLFFLPFLAFIYLKARGGHHAPFSGGTYSIPLILVSLILIFVSSDILVKSTVYIAQDTGISVLAISAYGIGFVSSIPEIIMISVALAGGRKIISMGIFTGSTIYKMGLIPAIIVIAEPTTFSGLFYMFLGITAMSAFIIAIGSLRRARHSGNNR